MGYGPAFTTGALPTYSYVVHTMYMYIHRPSFRNCVQGGLNNKCKKFGGANSFILILCLHVIVP